MATIVLVVLGMLKREALSAYEIQKLVEYRKISKWVKVSAPSIYKKVLQLEGKKLIRGTAVKEGKMPEKTVYSLTEAGEREFEALMLTIAAEPIEILLDFNAVIVNLSSLPPEKQALCVSNIEKNVRLVREELEESQREKAGSTEIPETGMAVLRQQLLLAEAIETWIASLKRG